MTIYVERGVSRELVDENCRAEPVCLKCSERLIVLNVGARHSDQRGLISINSRSSSAKE